jgi:hypothetical protein
MLTFVFYRRSLLKSEFWIVSPSPYANFNPVPRDAELVVNPVTGKKDFQVYL